MILPQQLRTHLVESKSSSNLVDTEMATAWLERTFQPYAAAEPRFWTVPPSYHVQELAFCVLMSSGAAVCAALVTTATRYRTSL